VVCERFEGDLGDVHAILVLDSSTGLAGRRPDRPGISSRWKPSQDLVTAKIDLGGRWMGRPNPASLHASHRNCRR